MMHHQLKHRPSCPFCHRQFRGPAILAKHVRSRHGITSYTYPPPDQLDANSVVENFVTTEPQSQADTTTAYSHVISASTNIAATLFNSGKAVENTSESMFLKLSDVSYSCVTNPAITSDPGDTSTAYRPYRCSLCAKSFFSRATLSVHMLRHSDSPLPHVCHFCPLRFATSSDLTHHVRSHSPRRRLRLARQMAQSASPLKWNSFSQCFLSTRRCRSDRSFKCSLCPRSYRHLIHLNYHVRQSHCPDQAPFECDKCARRFVNDRRLTRHVQKAHASPTSQSKLTCSVCTSHFATVSSLKRHMVIHSDSKPYKCHICHKMFKFHSSCVKHIKTHSSSVVDLDELPHQSDVVQFCPTSGESTTNLPATDGELVHQPKHSYTYAYFTDVQHEMCVRSTNATMYQTTRNVADETGLERGIIRDWSDSLLYDPSLFPGNDGMIIHPTDKAPTHCYSNLDPVNTETIITGHAVSGGAHTLSQYADCKHSETRGCPTGVFGTVSTNERREHMIPPVSGTVLYDTATVPVGHRLDLPEGTADSYNLVHPPIDSTKGTVVPGSHFNFCRLNPAPACPTFSDATVRSSVVNACEPNQSSQSFLLFGCGVCDASFEFPQSLAMHVQSNHSIRPKPFHCDTCGSCFASETLLIIHKREHSDVSATEISCPSCPLLEFGNKSALTRHVLLCHPLPTKDRFRCTHCNTRFRLLRSLKTHVAGLVDAAEQRRSESSVIEKSLKQVLTRRRKRLRERVHVIEPALLRSVTQKAHLPQECLILSEKYLLSCVRDLVTNSENNTKPSSPERNTAALNQDVDERGHIRVKRHLCPTCGRSFVSVSGLRHHTRAHLGIRPYKCTECGEQFTKNCLLQKHIIRTHTIQQPGDANLSRNPQEASLRSPACLVGFRCHLCDRTLWSKNSLRCHVRRHAASRTYKCIYCRARFTTWSQRQNHLHVCREFNDNIQEPPPTFRDRRTTVGSNVDRSVTDMTFPQASEIGLPDNMPVTGGDSSSSVPLMTSFLTEDGNQVLSLPVGANILIPVQVKEDLHTHPEWTSSILPSQVLFPGLYLAPFVSETDTFGSSEVISVVELSQTPSFVQTSLEPSTTVEVVDQPNSVLGSYHEAICCQSCHTKFPDSRAYFKHHCAKIALLHTMSPNPNAETNANVISRGRRRGVRPKRATSPGAGRSFRALHKCATCSRVFPQAYLLKRHERTHTNCRPFVCRFCGAGFSQSYSLTTHELIHSDAKPYTCTQCDRGFRQKSNLHRHIRLMHSSQTD
ncbi:unnamed protein product [Dicrocoelium dendriticum]|nr:unnamed protein product [Dicrocoelium dendriticum]